MNKIINQYGQCIIPKNTFLFRGYSNSDYQDVMFFTTKLRIAKIIENQVQVWITKSDIEVGFFVKYLNSRAHAISSIPEIYSNYFPKESQFQFNDLDIKLNPEKMSKLVSNLKQDKVSGWLTSYEDKQEVEVCIIDKQISLASLFFVENSDIRNSKYFKDSLLKIKLFPSACFYDLSKSKIAQNSTDRQYSRNLYIKYKNSICLHIKEEISNGANKIQSIHEYYNLRLKLKI